MLCKQTLYSQTCLTRTHNNDNSHVVVNLEIENYRLCLEAVRASSCAEQFTRYVTLSRLLARMSGGRHIRVQ